MAGRLRYFLKRDGRYFSRVTVPAEVQHIVGKTELRTPLGGDLRAAERQHLTEVAKLMAVVAEAQKKLALETGQAAYTPFPMTESEMAQTNYRLRLEQDEEARRTTYGYAKIGIDDTYVAALRAGIAGAASDRELNELVGHRIAMFRSTGNTSVELGTEAWRALAMKLCISEYEALERCVERDEGWTGGETKHPLLTKKTDPPKPAIKLRALFEDFLKHREGLGVAEATITKWKAVYRVFCDYVSHDNAAKITKADVRNWRDTLIGEKSASTVKKVYLAALNAAFNWAVSEDRLPENPAAGVQQAVAKNVVARPKGFSDEEALAIIVNSRRYLPKKDSRGQVREHTHFTRAKQWVPMLCAFSGARVSEITQLRKCDVQSEGGIQYIRITPEAGGNKSHQYRDVPLHQQLIDEGFLELVGEAADGPLFYDSDTIHGNYKKAQQQANRLAEWLRQVDWVPANVQPNHGWRHRFQTISRRYSQSEMVTNAIVSHGKKDVSHEYGEAELVSKKRVIDAIPAFDLRGQ